MKKVFALILALAMLLCCSALAETAEPETQTMTSVTGLFSLEIPADYVIFDAEILAAIAEGADSDFWADSNFTDQEIEFVIDMFSTVDFSTVDMIYAPDFIANINANVAAPSGLTRDMLPLVKESLDELLIGQYQSVLGVAPEDCTTKDLIYLGENQYACYVFEVNAMGTTMLQYVTLMDDGTQITVTFTAMDEETALSIIDTIVFLDPTAA